jgi:ABC-2 type transport system ATP-binding protein
MGRALNPRFDQRLAELRLGELEIPLRRRAGQLSGGEQAQVALALALAKHPQLLVLDEPVAGLDPLARRDFMQVLLTAVADHGTTVLLSSHMISELERLCDHLVVLTAGRVRLAGAIDELLAEHRTLTAPDGSGQQLVRTNGAAIAPGRQSHPVDLDELVLGYLRSPYLPDVSA